MTELFLIAHSVRGEAAFDVATQMECPHCAPQWSERVHGCFDCDSLGYWWIIPTSGHRAFPYWSVLLADIDDRYELNLECWKDLGNNSEYWPPEMPFGWPDHYRVGPTPTLNIMSLFKAQREAKPHIPRRL